MDELIGFLAEAAAASVRAASSEKLSANVKPHAEGHGAHVPNLLAAFHDRSSLLAALVAVETLGPPPSVRPRELRGDAW